MSVGRGDEKLDSEGKIRPTLSFPREKRALLYRRCSAARGGLLSIWDAVSLLGHSKLEITVRYLGIELEDALDIAEKAKV